MNLKYLSVFAFLLAGASSVATHAEDYKPSFYLWTNVTAPLKMSAVKDGFCLLAGVYGTIQDSYDWVNVYTQDGYWYLGGVAHHGVSGGSAYCLEYSKIKAPFKPISYMGTTGWFGCPDNGCNCENNPYCVYSDNSGNLQQMSGLNGKSGFVQGISGDFRSPSLWNSAPGVYSGLMTPPASTGIHGEIGGGVTCRGESDDNDNGSHFQSARVQIGVMSGGNEMPSMTRDTSSTAKETFNTGSLTMKSIGLPYTKYMCGLEAITGFLQSDQDSVQVITEAKTGNWGFFGSTMHGYIGASTWCFQYRP